MSESNLWSEYRDVMLTAKKTLARPSIDTTMRARLESLLREGDQVFDLDQTPDLYGKGVVASLERRFADLLGKPAAVFFPTGTMAQQVVLRAWAERSGRTKVALHALSHPEVFESNAFPRVSGLETVPIASGPHLIEAPDIAVLSPDIGAVMFELPLRDAGYLLPDWSDLVAATQLARERGIVVHFDGARLFDCTPQLGHSAAEIAALADSVYVSCYKTVDGMSGAVVAGPQDVLSSARAWRHRYGGQVYQQFPAALSALLGIEKELPRIASYVAAARRVASEIAAGLQAGGLGWHLVQPAVPHIQQFQVWVPRAAEMLTSAATEEVRETGKAIFQLPWWEPGMPPGLSVTEITVGAAAAEWEPGEVAASAESFAARLR